MALLAPAHGLGAVAVQHAQVRLDPVRVAPAPGPAAAVQDADGAPARLLRLGLRPARTSAAASTARPSPSLCALAGRPAEVDAPPPASPDRLVEVVDQHALLGVGLQQRRPRRRRRGAAKRSARAYCAAASRCAPSAAARAAAAGAWVSTAAASPAPSAWWARRARSGAPVGRRGQRAQRQGVERAASGRGDRVQDRLRGPARGGRRSRSPWRGACRGATHSSVAAAASATRACEQPGLHLGADERGGVERGAAGRRQARGAGQHGVAHSGRDAGLAAGQHLGDEERVAAGLAMQRGGVERAAGGERRHRGGRERQQRDAAHRLRRREVAQDDAQRVARTQLVVAVGQHQQRGHLANPPAEELDQVERRPRPPSAGPRAPRSRPAGGRAPPGPRRRWRAAGRPTPGARAARDRPAGRCRTRGPSGRGVCRESQAPQSVRAAPARSRVK